MLTWISVLALRFHGAMGLFLHIFPSFSTLRYWTRTHFETQVKVVFRPTRHDTVQAVNHIRNAERSVEQRVNLFRVGQVRLDRHGIITALGLFRLDNVGEDKVGVGGLLGVLEDLIGELFISIALTPCYPCQ